MRYYNRAGEQIPESEYLAEFKKNCNVAVTRVDSSTVSTVFMVIDHNCGAGEPILFETMVFGSDRRGIEKWTRRYSTEAEAIAGHNEIVAAIRDGKPSDA